MFSSPSPCCAGGRRARDHGSVNIEIVLLFPLVIAIVLGVVQTGLWVYARNVCSIAASEGARTGANLDATAADAIAAARDLLAGPGGGLVVDAVVTAERGTTAVTVTCSGNAMTIVPWLELTIEQSARLPVERTT